MSNSAFIGRRSRTEPTPDELEPSYAESVRRYNAAREAERLRRSLEFLIAFHEARAAKLQEGEA